MFDLYFSDLTTAAQARLLAACGLNNAAEGNYDVLPIVSLPCKNDEDEGEYEDSGWDLFFWCNCFDNTLRGMGVTGRDYSYFTLSFNETHSPEKRRELCDAVIQLLNEKFPEHPNLEITIQHEVHKDHSRIADEVKHIAPKLEGLKCIYHAKEGRIAKVGSDYFFIPSFFSIFMKGSFLLTSN